MEDEYLELEMDQQEHFHQPSVPKEHSGRAEVGEDGAHYGVSRMWPLPAHKMEGPTCLV